MRLYLTVFVIRVCSNVTPRFNIAALGGRLEDAEVEFRRPTSGLPFYFRFRACDDAGRQQSGACRLPELAGRRCAGGSGWNFGAAAGRGSRWPIYGDFPVSSEGRQTFVWDHCRPGRSPVRRHVEGRP